MKLRKPIGVIVLALVWVSIASAQRTLAPPKNLRIVNTSATRSEPSGRQHDYFKALVALPEHVRSWSLRDQAQLNGLAKLGTSNYFTYVFGSDSYSNPQDGAKFYKPVNENVGARSDSIPGNQQLRMPIQIGSGSVMVTWDFWFGPEFRTNIGNIDNYKIFQHRQRDDSRWWTHVVRFKNASAPNEVATPYDTLSAGRLNIPGLTKSKPYTPSGAGALGANSYAVNASVWTRWWSLVEFDVPSSDSRWDAWKSQSPAAAQLSGTWDMVSLWVADEQRDAVRLLYRVPASVDTQLASFDFEFNTSNRPSQTGPLVGYGRNVVVLHNYKFPTAPESDQRIFVRPTR
jgi:hypothetical protein